MSGSSANKAYAVQVNGFGLTAGNVNTIWELNPVTNPFTICEFAVSCNASVSSLPVQIDLYTSASVGSSAGNSASVRSLGSTTTTSTTTARSGFTVEPNPSTKQLVASWMLQPFGGILDIQYPLGREQGAIGGATTTGRIALQATAPAGTTLNVWSYVWFEE